MSDDPEKMEVENEKAVESKPNGDQVESQDTISDSQVEESPTKSSLNVTSSTEGRFLKEMKVPELRVELEKRGLSISGLKKVLVARLSKQLEADGHDPETFDFNQQDVDIDSTENSEEGLVIMNAVSLAQTEEPKDDASKNGEEKNDESDIKGDDDKKDENNVEPKEGEDGPDMDGDCKVDDTVSEILESKKDEEEKMDTRESETAETEEEMAESRLVSGPVVQFNSKKVIFEFSLNEETCIGEIKVDTLKHDSRGKAIPADVTDEDIGNHIAAGDEVKCHVIEKDDMEPFTYEQVSEECGDNDEIIQTKTEVVIQPKWLAIKGHVITEDESKKKNLNSEELLALNDQLDYEPEEEEEDGDMLLIEDVHFDDLDNSKAASKKSANDDDLEVLEVVSTSSAKKPMPASKKREAQKEADDESDDEPEETFEQKARLVQLRKPSSTTSGSTSSTHKPDVGKVTSCVSIKFSVASFGRKSNDKFSFRYLNYLTENMLANR